jgi:hypothetical protein
MESAGVHEGHSGGRARFAARDAPRTEGQRTGTQGGRYGGPAITLGETGAGGSRGYVRGGDRG